MLAAAGGSAITLGVLAAMRASIRPAPKAPVQGIDPEVLAAQLEGWAADLREKYTALSQG
jgi:hypothetical protein